MQEYDLVALRSFITVIDTGSFVRAAEQLEASTAAISRRISGLEQALGCQLINRTTRNLDLTDAGKRFYSDVLSIFQMLDEAEERVRVGKECISGVLRVAAPLSFGILKLSPLLPVFMKKYPELRVRLLVEDRYTDLQAEGIDVAIRIGVLKDSSLIATRLGSIERVFCAAPGYLATKGEPREPEDLRHHSCLHYSLRSVREEWGNILGDAVENVEIKGALSANNAEILRESAIQEMGITLLPRFVVEDALNDGRLHQVLARYSPTPLGLYCVRPSCQFTPARVRLFIDYLRDAFNKG